MLPKAGGFSRATGANSAGQCRACAARTPGWSVLEQFQEKCETVFRPKLRQNKELEQFTVSMKR
jgi:hypothetical protein